jgi:hypothetical protein
MRHEAQVSKLRADVARLIEQTTINVHAVIGGAFSFTFATPSPQLLLSLPAGVTFSRVSLFVQAPFSGGTPEIQLGTAASPSLFFDLTLPLLGVVLQYDFVQLVTIPAPDHFLLTLSPGLVAGSAILFYEGFQ